MRYKMFMGFVVLFLGCWTNYAQSQTASISGYITDSETGETLIGANIALIEINKGASSNTLGFYSIVNIQPGTYTLVCSYVGYDSFRKEVTLNPGDALRIEVELNPQGLLLDEVVVTSELEEEARKDIGSAQISTQLIKDLPTVFEADVFRSLQLLPGVKAASDFSSGLYIRGGGPDQTLILLDRTTVYNPSHFFGFFSTFNPDAIKDVQLFKGGYPAEFGGRLGSVLSIYNKDGNRNTTEGSVTVGMLASRASIEGPYKYGSYNFAIRRSTLEPLLAALRQNNDNIPSSFYFLDLNGKINFDAGQNDKFNLSFYSGNDVVNFPFADDADFNLNYGNQTLSSNWTHIFNERLFSNFVVTGARYFNFPELEFGGTPFERENNIWDFSVKGDLEYLPNDKHTVETGTWLGVMTLKLEDRFDNQDSFSSRIHARYGSWYLQDTWRPSERWKFVGGARLNYFSDGDYLRLEPRVSAEFKPTDRIRLQAAYGRYNQFLTLITNEAFSGFDVWLTSDEGVPPAYSDQFVIGTKTKPFTGYGFDVELYYRTMNDLFELDPFLPDAAGLPYDQIFRFGTGDAYGAEFFFEKQTGRFTGFIGYTLAYTWRKFLLYNNSIGDPDGGGRSFPPKYDRLNDINVVGSYRLSKKWKATVSFNYATGQAYTEPLGRYQLQDPVWTGEDFDVLTTGRINASRLPDYHRLDIAFSRYATFFGMGSAEWQFQIVNVYSRRNVWFYLFDFEDNPITRNEVNLLPILPTVSYTVNF
ncbi:MAG: TonB-dependent receptor [Bacteroidota bacterium]